jgi:3-methyladenine DNA glycosylase AlkD
MARLEEMGTPQNRKMYVRHGVPEPLFGVSYASLEALARQIGVDQPLAERLWASGNHDAQVLATRVADPARFGRRDLDLWARALSSYVLTEAFSALAGRTAHARVKADAWGRARGEWKGQAGWNLVAYLALHDRSLDDAYFAERLEQIAADIHDRPNRVRHAMNGALIAIGLRNPRLEGLALEAARRIGPVEVDHGDTTCETPDAAGYIAKAKRGVPRQGPPRRSPGS